MATVRISPIAGQRLDEIYAYTCDRWGAVQADAYIRSIFDCFDRIARRETPWRAIPAEFGVDGFFGRHVHHYVYWRLLSDASAGIVTVLHKRMHRMDRFRDDIAP